MIDDRLIVRQSWVTCHSAAWST